MILVTYTAEQVRRDDVLEQISKLLEVKEANLTSTRDVTERHYELKIRVPINPETSGVIDSLTRLSTEAALS